MQNNNSNNKNKINNKINKYREEYLIFDQLMKKSQKMLNESKVK